MASGVEGRKAEFRIAVLISGGGTTLRNLIELGHAGQFSPRIALVISSSSKAKGLSYAAEAGIPSIVAVRRPDTDPHDYESAIFGPCREHQIDLVVMGGFLKHVPIPSDYVGRVVNIHPSLIPSFCGQGMYGLKVHEAVLEYGAAITGCTVHFVDDHYDHGPIIAQRCVPVLPDDDAATLQRRVFREECRLYPEIIERLARGELHLEGRRVRPSSPQQEI